MTPEQEKLFYLIKTRQPRREHLRRLLGLPRGELVSKQIKALNVELAKEGLVIVNSHGATCPRYLIRRL